MVTVLFWQGQKDLKLPLRNIVALLAWSASHCSLFLHLSVTPSSATGGGAPLRPGTLREPRVQVLIYIKTKRLPNGNRFALAGAEGLEPSARGFGDRCSTN